MNRLLMFVFSRKAVKSEAYEASEIHAVRPFFICFFCLSFVTIFFSQNVSVCLLLIFFLSFLSLVCLLYLQILFRIFLLFSFVCYCIFLFFLVFFEFSVYIFKYP